MVRMYFKEPLPPEKMQAFTGNFTLPFFQAILKNTNLGKVTLAGENARVEVIDPYLLNDIHTASRCIMAAADLDAWKGKRVPERRQFCLELLDQYAGLKTDVFPDWAAQINTGWCSRTYTSMKTHLRSQLSTFNEPAHLRIVLARVATGN